MGDLVSSEPLPTSVFRLFRLHPLTVSLPPSFPSVSLLSLSFKLKRVFMPLIPTRLLPKRAHKIKSKMSHYNQKRVNNFGVIKLWFKVGRKKNEYNSFLLLPYNAVSPFSAHNHLFYFPSRTPPTGPASSGHFKPL